MLVKQSITMPIGYTFKSDLLFVCVFAPTTCGHVCHGCVCGGWEENTLDAVGCLLLSLRRCLASI